MASPTIRDIREVTQRYFGISGEDMLSPRRTYRIAHPRQLAMLIAREQTGRSLLQIGRAFNRDHSTVIHAIRSASERVAGQLEWTAAHMVIVASLGDRGQ